MRGACKGTSRGVPGADPGGFVGFGRTPFPSETKKFFEAILVGRG